ncbi:MAG: ABC transporter permease [Actinobacteria bacterium]|nr:ABC transporter permease [Actinomycetota bacterium]
MSPWAIVTRREVLVRLTDKAFIIGTLIFMALLLGVTGWAAYQDSGVDHYEVASTPADRAMVASLEANAPEVDGSVRVSAVAVADASAARAALADGRVDAWLHRRGDGWELLTQSETKTSLFDATQQVVRGAVVAANARAAGTTAEAIQRGATVTSRLVEGNVDRENLGRAAGMIFAFVFYLSSLMFGVQLAGSVVEEKQNRIVEIIASAIPVRHLLAGKIIGNTLVAMLQVVVYIAVGLVGLSFTSYGTYVPELTGPVVWFFAFFLAGFVALASLWAVAGALASRMEDLQATTTPLTLMVMVMFFGSLLFQGTARVIASFAPPFSAVLMPIRIVEQDASAWEALIALTLLLAFTLVTILVGERLYRRSLLQSGGRVGLRAAWSAPE